MRLNWVWGYIDMWCVSLQLGLFCNPFSVRILRQSDLTGPSIGTSWDKHLLNVSAALPGCRAQFAVIRLMETASSRPASDTLSFYNDQIILRIPRKALKQKRTCRFPIPWAVVFVHASYSMEGIYLRSPRSDQWLSYPSPSSDHFPVVWEQYFELSSESSIFRTRFISVELHIGFRFSQQDGHHVPCMLLRALLDMRTNEGDVRIPIFFSNARVGLAHGRDLIK